MLAETSTLRKKPEMASTVFKMFEDTVYAYEFALAQMELSELSGSKVPFGLPEGLVQATVDVSVLPTLIERLAYFEQVGPDFTHQKFLTEVQGAVAGNHAKALQIAKSAPVTAEATSAGP